MSAWIRSERPDGHRSLWYKTHRWLTIERESTGLVSAGFRGEPPTYSAPAGLDWITTRWGCPVPTAEDLGWLRGGA